MTKQEMDQLDAVGWGTYWFGSLATPKRDGNMALRSLVTRGLVERVGFVDLCDGDGFQMRDVRGYDRQSMGWKLTDAGVAACEGWRDRIRTQGRGPR